jgi:hypothetical protein
MPACLESKGAGKGEEMQISRLIRYSLFALLLLAIPASSFAGVFVQVAIAPPALPVYVQPACPGDGYIWTPGYWAYGPDGYYWVPGTWVLAPEPGLLWTPGYWGWNAGFYAWHPGYWGPHVGFYGGINYGFGYFGVGYGGGYWSGRTFFYNRSVNNVTITNVHIYNKTVVNNVTVNRVSYNGGHGGIMARPGHTEEVAFRERRFEPTRVQLDHEHGARSSREFLASVNHGRPAVGATERPGEFRGHGDNGRPAGVPRPIDNRGPEHRMTENRENHAMNRDVPRPAENRATERRMPENHAMNRDDARPQGGGRNMDRPMPRQNEYGKRNTPRDQPRGPVATRSSAYHPEPHAQERGQGGDKQENRSHGPKH